MSNKRLLVSLLFFSLAYVCIKGAVIGIDFGNEFFKVSLISPGKSFVIIENTVSKRKTPTTIAFLDNERLYEYDALGKRSRNPKNTFVFIQKFLGAMASDEKVFEISRQNYEDYLISFDEDRKTVLFELNEFKFEDSEGENVKLSVEEVIAMIFRHARRLAEKQAKVQIKDCVITVPPNWSLNRRRALIDAGTLSGLTTLSLVHENTAAALYYGINRLDENKTHTVLFYNMGSNSLQVSLVEYGAANSTDKEKKPLETIRVLADTVEERISGLAFDRVLVDIFADEFDKLPARKGKESVRTSKSAMIKLLKESNKFKETLSANKDAMFYSENLFEGVDFKSHIQRSQFEEKSQHLLKYVTSPIDYVLKVGNRTLQDIDVLEIIGGSVRVPKVQQILTQYLEGKELGAHLNGDESMAFGAAFLAANLSHSFRVRPVWLYDGYNFQVNLTLRNLRPEDESYEKNILIFPYKQRFRSKKVISVYYDKDIQATLTAVHLDGTTEPLTVMNFTNVSAIANEEKYKALGKPKLHFQFVISSTFPTIELELAEATLEELKLIEIEEPKKAGRKKTNKTKTDNSTNSSSDSNNTSENTTNSENSANGDNNNNNNTNETSSSQEEEKRENNREQSEEESQQKNEETNSDKQGDSEEKKEEAKTEGAQNKEEESQSQESSQNNQTETPPPKRYKNKTITHYIPLAREIFHHGLQPLNETEVKNSSKKLKKFDRLEESKKKLAEAKNRLEAFIYKSKEYLEDDEFKKFSSAEEKADLERLASENDEWLYSDEAGVANYTEFKKRYNKMNNIAQDVTNRIDEHKKSPEAVKDAKKKLDDYEKKIAELNKTMPWVNETVKNNLLSEIKSTRNWLQQKKEEDDSKALYETKTHLVSQLEHQLNQIKEAFTNIKNIKKPKEKKPKKKSNETNSTNTTSAKSEEDSTSSSKSEDSSKSETPKEEKKFDRDYPEDDSASSSKSSSSKSDKEKAGGEKSNTQKDKKKKKKEKEEL